MIKRKFYHCLYRYILPYGGLLLVKIIALTYRVRVVDPENESYFLDNGNSLIYASWHQRFFPGIAFFAKRKPIAIMISQSRDGEFISHIVNLLGWHPIRGSSSRGGGEALKELKKLALSGYKIGHIVDGPKGPSGVVKPGLLRIAQVTGIPIVPTITSAQKRWVFNSWDRFMVPKPFSRVIIRFGQAIYVPAYLNKDDFEKQRLLVEQKMKELYDDTDLIWTHRIKISDIFNEIKG
jgi:lysophospholipid acyltransferase (LPLAT)-like uncharacterized protein